MALYNWDKDDITNSNLTSLAKEILLGEINEEPSSCDPNVQRIKPIWHIKEKISYQKALKELYRDLLDIILFIKQSYKSFPISYYTFEDIPDAPTTPESLLKYTEEFYEFLGDEDLVRQYNYYINQKGILRIQPYNPANPICQAVKGRCFFDSTTQNAFLSYYIRGKLDDYSSFTHETAHLVIETLFQNQMNPIIEKHLTEYAAYYLQIISYCFYSIRFKKNEIFPVLLHNHIVNAINNIWFLYVQSIAMQKRFTKATPEYLDRQLKEENLEGIFETDNINAFYTNPTKIFESIIAFFMALDTFANATPTFDIGVANFKKTLISNATSATELFQNHNITFMEDNLANTKNYYEKSLGIHLK